MESCDAHNSGEDLRAQLEALQQLLDQKDRPIEQLESKTEDMQLGLQEAKETASNKVSTLEQQLEETKLRGELMLRALEGLRTEHQ